MYGIARHTKVFTRRGFCSAEELRWLDDILMTDDSYQEIDSIQASRRTGEEICKIRVGKQYCSFGNDMQMTVGHFDQETVHDSKCKACDIKPGDFVKMIIPRSERDIPGLSIDDCRMCGIICRYGGFLPSYSGIEQVILDETNVDEKGIVNFIKAYLDSRKIDLEITKHVSTTRLSWNKLANKTCFLPTLLRDMRMRRLPYALLNLPINKTTALVDAMMGHAKCITIDCPKLVDDLQYMLYRLQRPAHVMYRGSEGLLKLWNSDDYKVFGNAIYLKVTETLTSQIGDIMYEIVTTGNSLELETIAGQVACTC